MKDTVFPSAALLRGSIGILLWAALTAGGALGQSSLLVTPRDETVRIAIDARPFYSGGREIQGTVVLEQSDNLKDWTELRELRGDWLPFYRSGFNIPSEKNSNFYRLNFEGASTQAVTDQAAEFYGYNGAFREALMERPVETADDLLSAYPPRDYESGLEFSLESAAYFDLLNSTMPINAAEMDLLKENGFVVSESLGSHSYADLFYRLWTNDLPVFLSADSMLHAWQFSCREVLAAVEQDDLYPKLRALVKALRDELKAKTGERYRDLDVYLSVTQALLGAAAMEPPTDEQIADAINQGAYSVPWLLRLNIEGNTFDLDYNWQDVELSSKNVNAISLLHDVANGVAEPVRAEVRSPGEITLRSGANTHIIVYSRTLVPC
jgi:hypothetical protein